IHRVARGILAFGLFCAAPGLGPVAPDGLARSAVVHLDAYRDHFFFIGAHHRRAAPAPITAAVAAHADSRTIAVVIVGLAQSRFPVGADADLHVALGASRRRAQAALIERAGDHFLQLFGCDRRRGCRRAAPAPVLIAGEIARRGRVDGRLSLLDRRWRRNRRRLAGVGVVALAGGEAQTEQWQYSAARHEHLRVGFSVAGTTSVDN